MPLVGAVAAPHSHLQLFTRPAENEKYKEDVQKGRNAMIALRAQVERAFRDFQPYLGKCKYYNCRHLIEPQCAILAAVAEGKIAKFRHTLYGQLLHESAQTLY